MMKRKDKPKLYFDHKQVINEVPLGSDQLNLYLHENMLDFFGDMSDVADCLDVFSLTNYLENCVPFNFDVRKNFYFLRNLLFLKT